MTPPSSQFVTHSVIQEFPRQSLSGMRSCTHIRQTLVGEGHDAVAELGEAWDDPNSPLSRCLEIAFVKLQARDGTTSIGAVGYEYPDKVVIGQQYTQMGGRKLILHRLNVPIHEVKSMPGEHRVPIDELDPVDRIRTQQAEKR
jgi:hypothetical protein